MRLLGRVFFLFAVALLAEGVDRNKADDLPTLKMSVALLAEGVDRNGIPTIEKYVDKDVALLAEGVDRNLWKA